MRRFHTRYLTALLCMLAVGTWILPVHTLAAPAPAPAHSAVLGDAETVSAVAAFRDGLEAMRLAGELDRPAFAFTGHDLSGDGVDDVISVSPPQRFETPGFIRIMDGATGAQRQTLRAPDGEMGFGEHTALVTDVDGDGLPEIAALSWSEADGDASVFPMHLRIRVFSSFSGELIGLLQTDLELGSPLDAIELHVAVAADADLDGSLDAADIVDASGMLAADAAVNPSVDCNADGEITMADFSEVVERVLDEPQVQRATLYSMALRNIEVVEAIAPPEGGDPTQMGGGGGGGAGAPPCTPVWQGGWGCWIAAGAVAARTAYVIAKLLACAAGPQLLACLLPILCSLLTLLAAYMEFYNRCFQTPGCVSPLWTTINSLLALVGLICEGAVFTYQNWQKIKDGLKRLRGLQPPNSVALGA